jgi:hypothetical protein
METAAQVQFANGQKVMYNDSVWIITNAKHYPTMLDLKMKSPKVQLVLGTGKTKEQAVAPEHLLRALTPEELELEGLDLGFLKAIATCPNVDAFIEKLRSDYRLYAKTKSGTRARLFKDQYFTLTGKPLVEGQSFSVYEDGANKHGAEGCVYFPKELLSAVPEELSGMVKQDKAGNPKINYLGFYWLCVTSGFRN